MAALLDTPSRVLRRVQQYEDMELPSLPSFQHDIDFESDQSDHFDNSYDVSMSIKDVNDMGTPYIPRSSLSPPPTESTIVPRSRTPPQLASPLPAGDTLLDQSVLSGTHAGFTSTPYSEQFNSSVPFLEDLSASRSLIRDSDVAPPHTEDWDNTSASFRLPAPSAASELQQDNTELADPSLPQPSFLSDQSLAATPVPRHFDARTKSASPPAAIKSPLLTEGTGSRIPSLSRSEFSGTDNEATTPEGPDRFVEAPPKPTAVDADGGNYEFNTTMASRASLEDITEGMDAVSPAKSNTTSNQATPAAMRYMDMPSTAARAAATPFPNVHGNALRDVTPVFRNRAPYTPSPDYSPSAADPSTPRAPLDDAERRKSHVLSVLASSSLPSRTKKRSTPFPARRVSLAPETESIAEESGLGITFARSLVADDTLQSVANESFVSIASSQDLTMDRRGSRAHNHQRGNTSVPNILMGASATSPGLALNLDNRPDAIKIHKHLNMMNKQLLDTNAELAREAEDWRDECERLMEIMAVAGIELDEDGRVIDGNSTRRGKHGSVVLDTSSTSDLHALEKQLKEKDDIMAKLRTEATGSGEVTLLRAQLEESETAHAALQAQFAKKTEDHAQRFAEICTDFEEQVGVLEGELATARTEANRLREKHDSLTSTLHDETQVQLREEIHLLRADLNYAQEAARAASEQASAANEQASAASEKASVAVEQASSTHSQFQAAEKALQLAETRYHELEIKESAQHHQLLDSETQLAELRLQVETAEKKAADATEQLAFLKHGTATEATLEDEIQSLQTRVHGLEHSLAATEREVDSQRNSAEALRDTVEQQAKDVETAQQHLDDLRRELEHANALVSAKEEEVASLQNHLEVAQIQKELPADDLRDPGDSSLVMALEDRLDEAYREIGRLKHEVNESPARKSAIEARDARIKTLEIEKLSLQERLKGKEVASPTRWANSMMTSTPIVNKALASLRMPATPGPMRDISWLQTTIGDSNESILRAQLEHLQQELDIANTQLDRNFGRLEDAGLGALNLAEKLAIAKDRIAQLEEQLRAMARDNKQSLASLNIGRTTNDQLERSLEAVRAQMDELKSDMSAEKERLHDDNRRLRVMLSDLQIKCDEELESLSLEMVRMQREADDKATDSEEQLQALRSDKDGLEAKLRVCRTSVTRLEQDLARAQQSNDAAVRKDNRIRDQSAAIAEREDTIKFLQSSLAETRDEAGKIRDTLRQRVRALEIAERRVSDLQAERTRVTRELVEFGEDLNVQRQECAKFGAELATLRQEQADGTAVQVTNMGKLEDQLRWTRNRLDQAISQAQEADSRCILLETQAAEQASQSRTATDEQRHKFKVQTRRLSAQIEYLKAKYTREATFRNALSLQKKFLLLLVGGMSLNEQATLRAIASMGYPTPPPTHPKRTLKAVGLAVLALVRVRRMADQWKMTKETRSIGVARK